MYSITLNNYLPVVDCSVPVATAVTDEYTVLLYSAPGAALLSAVSAAGSSTSDCDTTV
jgi:hypothetical protein